jgi:hypothetical protein
MSNIQSGLPRKKSEFVELCKKWVAGLSNSAVITAFGWLPAYVTAVLTAIEAFLLAHNAYQEDNSTKNRIAKDNAMKTAQNAMRGFANTSIRYNKLMTEEQKWEYGVPTADPTPTPTPTPKPTTVPEAESDTSVIRQITIHFWDKGSKSRAKPQGIHGAEQMDREQSNHPSTAGLTRRSPVFILLPAAWMPLFPRLSAVGGEVEFAQSANSDVVIWHGCQITALALASLLFALC